MPQPKLRSYFAQLPALRNGAMTPRAFLEETIEALDTWQPVISAFNALDLKGARAAADRATARWRAGTPLSPIDGMPVGIKDVFETAGLPTTQGSPLFTNWQSGRDAAAVVALREAGAVILGKTVTTEFAATEPGPTRNPWNAECTPGGSSSGSAAGVGAGIIPAALGTQVIGSIIRPASYCGCFGYKPSVGSLNRGGAFDYLSQSSAGTLAASLAELWTVARTISARAGGDPGFPGLSGPMELPEPRSASVLAVLDTDGMAAASPQAVAKLHELIEHLGRTGTTFLTRRDNQAVAAVETALVDAGTLARQINCWEFRWPLNTYSRDLDHQKLSLAMRQRLAEAEEMTLEMYQRLLVARERVRATYAALAEFCEGCITLAAPGAAPKGIASTGDPTFAVPASLLGVPSVSIPLFTVDDMPLGLQMIGFRDCDAELFATASQVASRAGMGPLSGSAGS